ncbi:hypothetical protein ACK2EI_003486 [Salmonella enterica]
MKSNMTTPAPDTGLLYSEENYAGNVTEITPRHMHTACIDNQWIYRSVQLNNMPVLFKPEFRYPGEFYNNYSFTNYNEHFLTEDNEDLQALYGNATPPAMLVPFENSDNFLFFQMDTANVDPSVNVAVLISTLEKYKTEPVGLYSFSDDTRQAFAGAIPESGDPVFLTIMPGYLDESGHFQFPLGYTAATYTAAMVDGQMTLTPTDESFEWPDWVISQPVKQADGTWLSTFSLDYSLDDAVIEMQSPGFILPGIPGG